jgi:hypothetical protein
MTGVRHPETPGSAKEQHASRLGSAGFVVVRRDDLISVGEGARWWGREASHPLSSRDGPMLDGAKAAQAVAAVKEGLECQDGGAG